MMSVRTLYLLVALSGAAFADEIAAIPADALSDRGAANYVSDITKAIQRQFYDADRYKGKVCELNLKIDRDGNVLGVTSEQGDKELCNRTLKMVSYAKLPKPPSDEVWSRVKNVTLSFRP